MVQLVLCEVTKLMLAPLSIVCPIIDTQSKKPILVNLWRLPESHECLGITTSVAIFVPQPSLTDQYDEYTTTRSAK